MSGSSPAVRATGRSRVLHIYSSVRRNGAPRMHWPEPDGAAHGSTRVGALRVRSGAVTPDARAEYHNTNAVPVRELFTLARERTGMPIYIVQARRPVRPPAAVVGATSRYSISSRVVSPRGRGSSSRRAASLRTASRGSGR